jgi:hypothetical protein
MRLSFLYHNNLFPIPYVLFLWRCIPHRCRPPRCRGFTIILRHATPDGTPPNGWSASRTGRCLHNTPETQDTNSHVLSRIRTLDPSNTATSVPRLKPYCHWDRPSWCYCKAVFLLCRFFAIGEISAICEIIVFRVHNIPSLYHVMSQINPIYMLFKNRLLFCLHVYSSNLIHSSVSTPTITNRA